ncbi:MAG TPA: glycosyltransferase family 2 protein [Roseiarcus sp.]|nr:glycosyltransferase family 2 protein [Roseiarcus sp.]
MNSDPAMPEARPTLSVVVPTYREAANVPVLFERLKAALAGLPWEMIVVDDDSPDGTADVAYALAARDPRARCIRRVNRRGLAGAVIEGWLSSSADLVAVIDGDLQHDESILPKMYAALAAGHGNLAIGSRVADEATPGGLSPARQKLSDLGAWFFRRVAGAAVRDPMSGFFMIRREIVSRLAPRLSPDGFKILVDVILSSHGDLKIVETPYVFRKRQAGESKLSPLVGLDFIGLVVHHASGGLLPIRFVLFASIGAIGLVVHLLVLTGLIERLGAANFVAGQMVATLTAMASNFLLNNEITYRAHRYRGFGLLAGFAQFAVLCSVGALANIDIASSLFARERVWWAAGLAGALIGVVWNYAASSTIVWRKRRKV